MRKAQPFTPENAILYLQAQARHHDEEMHFLEGDACRAIIATIEQLRSAAPEAERRDEELLDCRAKLALAAEENMGNEDVLNRIIPWLKYHERDIALDIEDFGDLHSVFHDLLGRDPSREPQGER